MTASFLWSEYLDNVKRDVEEARQEYPFTEMTVLPTKKPQPIIITLIAVNKKIIDATIARKEDFLGKYTKKIVMEVPYEYKIKGCKVYGAGWLDEKRIPREDFHFNGSKKTQYGYEMCIGTPESFYVQKNVILENIRTAEAMLVAYEKVMRGIDSSINLIAYDHGNRGRQQFLENSKKYISR